MPSGDDQVGHGVVQRVARCEQLGPYAVHIEDVLDLEGDAVIAGGDRAASRRAQLRRGVSISNRPCSRRRILPPSRVKAARKALRCSAAAAVVPRLVHQLAQARDVRCCSVSVTSARSVSISSIPWATPASMTFSMFARVSGSSPYRIASISSVRSGVSPNAVPSHVEHLAAVGLALLLDLQQQTLNNLALAGVRRPRGSTAAHLVLADSMDPAEPLLDPVRVPRQVVVDHQMRDLEVQTLTAASVASRTWHAGCA